MAPPTIIAHKSAFLTAQTLHLSQAPTPSAAWRAANERAEDGLSARAVDDALYRLTHALTQHARRVYAPQASRLVAEQIEGLFHADAERAAARGNNSNDDDDEDLLQLRVGADFTTDEAIAALPPSWDHKPREAAANPLEARRYAELAARLADLSAKRQAARERVERLRRMAALLAPFDSTQPQSQSQSQSQSESDTHTQARPSVQDNLVTRNGEIERELERMRLLLARVAGRVAQLPDKSLSTSAEGGGNDGGGDATDLDFLEREKVEKLLERL